MKYAPGDFVQTINPIRGGLEVVMIHKTSVQGGVVFYWVSNGVDYYEACMVKEMPAQASSRRLDKKRRKA